MSVNNVFLNENNDEKVYNVLPENFVLENLKYMISIFKKKLKKIIYALKKASDQWFNKFHYVIISHDFGVNAIGGSKFCYMLLTYYFVTAIYAYWTKPKDF